ncbi:TPA: hypothetical protein N2G37_001559 [Salmonella enterica]|uniref:hypothetical protein n=1 Tax=Salmonella enterica TaxID=28901 RepID=UPI0012FDF0C0|nr:hypothetical protein [Salmonella enterica]
MSGSEKAETFFCLGAAFCRYSSSAVFGTEWESPQILRVMPVACWKKHTDSIRHCLPLKILRRKKGWAISVDGCGVGMGGHFTCTAVLSDILVDHAEKT